MRMEGGERELTQDTGAGDGGEEDDAAACFGGDHVAGASLGDEEGAG